jgi:signal transduction histidine kinase/ActR/RegA family two-component response regulator
MLKAVPPPSALNEARSQLDRQVEAELVRTAFQDAIYGAPFGMVVALLYASAIRSAFPISTVLLWLAVALTCNALRLVCRWAYLRQPVPPEATGFWRNLFTAVSAATGASWGAAAWMFYPPHESVYRVMIVLVIAGLTTGASRLLAPVVLANLSYVYLSIGPLLARLLLNVDTRNEVLGVMCVLYLSYMSVAARQQIATLRRSVRLGYENAALADSLGAAKERAEQLNRDLSSEITRREGVETELRAASERALAGSRAKSEFLATMSHEIRTPMNGLIGMLRIVHDTPLSPAQRDYLETATASADSLLEILNDILDFSKIEAGHLVLESIPLSPAAVAASAVELLRPRATAKHLNLQLDLAPDLPAGLLGDPTRLRQVLINLIGNAIKFTESGAVRVSLRATDTGPGATAFTVAVTDSGIGMDDATLDRLFRPFSQADSSMSRRFGGTGLGLAICRKLIEAMHGTITVRSSPGQGSTFEFTFPTSRVELPPAASAPAAFALPRLRGRVLVVEDDRTNQRVILHFLQKMGLAHELTCDGHAAVETALQDAWDVVLMDCQLPGIDGLEATRRIRRRLAGRRLPIIALTANASTQDRANCLAAGMDDFLTKPVRLEQLAAALQQWLPAESR